MCSAELGSHKACVYGAARGPDSSAEPLNTSAHRELWWSGAWGPELALGQGSAGVAAQHLVKCMRVSSSNVELLLGDSSYTLSGFAVQIVTTLAMSTAVISCAGLHRVEL